MIFLNSQIFKPLEKCEGFSSLNLGVNVFIKFESQKSIAQKHYHDLAVKIHFGAQPIGYLAVELPHLFLGDPTSTNLNFTSL